MLDQAFNILKVIGRKNQLSALFIIVISLINIILELLTFTLIIPLLSIFSENDYLNNTSIYIFFKNLFPYNFEQYLTITNILKFFVVIILIKAVLTLYFHYKINKVTWQIRTDINSKIYNYFTMISMPEIIKVGFSSIRRLINSDATLFVTQGFYNYIVLCKNFILIIILFFFLLQIDVKATLIIFSSFIGFILIYNKLIKKVAIKLAKEFKEFSEFKFKNVNDTIMGIREVKLFNNEDMVVDLFKKNEIKLSIIDIKKNIFNIIPRLLLELLAVIGITIAVLYFTSNDYNLMEIFPKLTLFFLVFVRTLPIAVGINGSLTAIRYSKLQIDEIIKQLKELNNKKELINSKNLQNFDLSKNKELELKNVSFGYNNSKTIFENVNVKFFENNLIGIQGDNGSGKSTLVDLIAGFMKPSVGNIMFNGKDIHENIKGWRKLIGYVSQTQFLTSDTLKKNIIFSNNEIIDDQKFDKAITESGVKNFLKEMPDGIDSEIGDLGLKLSGGQKQRVTIARVLYKDPKIIILDEPTSAQDYKIEDYFLNVINKLKKDKIIIIISHSKLIHAVCDVNYRVENKTLIKV